MSERSELHDAIERAIKEHCAGGDLWLCAHIASEPFDARIAELEREIERLDAQWRDELRIYRETDDARIAELEAEVSGLRVDAERWRKLRGMHWSNEDDFTVTRGRSVKLGFLAYSGEQLDAAIDAARANGGGE